MSRSPLTAQLALRCCGTALPVRTEGPCWQLYVAVLGTPEWPAFTWPTSPAIPSLAQRGIALTVLGYAPIPDAEWTWCETTSPENHDHPVAVRLLATIPVQPVQGFAGVVPAGRDGGAA